MTVSCGFRKVIPLGLHIPVGWRQPSYKSKKEP